MNIYLCKNTNLINDYKHTVCFKNSLEQNTYFSSKVLTTVDVNMKPDSMRSEITVPSSIESIELVDYLYFTNNNKYYFYFVNSVTYNTGNTCKLDVECDVIQTYLFDMNIKESFVVRSHMPRWNGDEPYHYLEEEGLEYGEYELKEQEKLYEFKNQYLITSSSPLGKIDYTKKQSNTEGGDTGGEITGDWRNGVLSSKVFRFLKGYEGFAPYHYDDGFGYLTIGYGVTKHGEPDIYNQLVAKEPISEEEASKVSYDLKIKRYGKPIVQACIDLGITMQRQFDALLDLAYNAGTGVITGSNSLTNVIRENPNDEGAIRPVWEKFYTSAGGQSNVPGLVARRKAECDIYFKGVYENRAIPKLNQKGAIVGTVTENGGNGWLPTDQGRAGDFLRL